MTPRTAIVTGASSGAGAAIARRLIDMGYNVMLAAHRLAPLVVLAEELGERAAHHQTDVTNEDEVAALVAATDAAFGQTDVMINNAGIMPLSQLSSRRIDDWNEMVDVNIRSAVHGIGAVVAQMILRKDGHIVNVASIAALSATPLTSVNPETTHGLRSLSDSLREEMRAHNVRVTAITTGRIATDFGDSLTDENLREALEGHLTLELVEPETIAGAVAYALDQPASVCVGDIIIRPTSQA